MALFSLSPLQKKKRKKNKKKRPRKKKKRHHAECAALPLHACAAMPLRVCAALPLNETHTRFFHIRETELVHCVNWASLKEHRHAEIACLCMEPLRPLEGNCKDL
jgi:hypothetical protein